MSVSANNVTAWVALIAASISVLITPVLAVSLTAPISVVILLFANKLVPAVSVISPAFIFVERISLSICLPAR